MFEIKIKESEEKKIQQRGAIIVAENAVKTFRESQIASRNGSSVFVCPDGVAGKRARARFIVSPAIRAGRLTNCIRRVVNDVFLLFNNRSVATEINGRSWTFITAGQN